MPWRESCTESLHKTCVQNEEEPGKCVGSGARRSTSRLTNRMARAQCDMWVCESMDGRRRRKWTSLRKVKAEVLQYLCAAVNLRTWCISTKVNQQFEISFFYSTDSQSVSDTRHLFFLDFDFLKLLFMYVDMFSLYRKISQIHLFKIVNRNFYNSNNYLKYVYPSFFLMNC